MYILEFINVPTFPTYIYFTICISWSVFEYQTLLLVFPGLYLYTHYPHFLSMFHGLFLSTHLSYLNYLICIYVATFPIWISWSLFIYRPLITVYPGLYLCHYLSYLYILVCFYVTTFSISIHLSIATFTMWIPWSVSQMSM